jgi:hypothetical protein
MIVFELGGLDPMQSRIRAIVEFKTNAEPGKSILPDKAELRICLKSYTAKQSQSVGHASAWWLSAPGTKPKNLKLGYQ